MFRLSVLADQKRAITGCRHENLAVGELEHTTDTRENTIRERIMYETVDGFVITVEAAVGTHPEPAFFIQEQAYNDAVAD